MSSASQDSSRKVETPTNLCILSTPVHSKNKNMNTKSLLYLWNERTLYLGRLDAPLSLSQGAATLCVSLEGPMSITLPKKGKVFQSQSVLLPPGYSVHIDTHRNLIANLNLDVMGADYFYLAKQMNHSHFGVHFELNNQDDFVADLSSIHEQEYSSTEARVVLYNRLSKHSKEQYHVDERVEKIVHIIQHAIDHNLSIEHLAAEVNLSVPGLIKLFKKQTGVPIRRYRQWHRLFVTATEIGKGKSLTDAALAAGFVDLSHCTNTFNTMLGMRPSYFLQRPDEIRVMTETNERLSCLALD